MICHYIIVRSMQFTFFRNQDVSVITSHVSDIACPGYSSEGERLQTIVKRGVVDIRSHREPRSERQTNNLSNGDT